MTLLEGMRFLLRRARLLDPEASPEQLAPEDVHVAQAIVEIMDGLPLALDQAGAYLEATQCGLSDYLCLLQSSPLRLLAEREAHTDHPFSVTQTFTLLFERLEQSYRHAAELLTACAFLAPEAIPEEVFLEGAVQLESTFEVLAADPFQFQDAVKALLTSSLIQRNTTARTLTIHRLVQAVLKGRLLEPEREQWLKRVVTMLNWVFPAFVDTEIVEPAVWNQCERLVSHTLHCAEHASSLEQPDETLASLLLKAGRYLTERAQYEEAGSLLQQALHIREQTFGTRHPDVASVLNALGILSFVQGKFVEAQHWHQQALEIAEHTLGADHPHVAEILTGLAIQYAEQGKYAEAESFLQKAIQIREQMPEAAPAQLADSLVHLGDLYLEQEKYIEAERVLKRALQLKEQTLGTEHLLVSYALGSLGRLYIISKRDMQRQKHCSNESCRSRNRH